MIAVLSDLFFQTTHSEGLHDVMGKPAVFHVLDLLVEQDISRVYILAQNHISELSDRVQHGWNWSIPSTVVPVSDAQAARIYLRSIATDQAETAIVCLPLSTIPASIPARGEAVMDSNERCIGFCDIGRRIGAVGRDQWCSALHLKQQHINSVAAETMTEQIGTIMSAHELTWSGHMAERDIAIGAGSSIDPSATLIAPVFIGKNCRISAGATVGPNVSIGNDCVVGRNAHIHDSVIAAENVIHDQAALDHVHCDHHLHAQHQQVTDIRQLSVAHLIMSGIGRCFAVLILALLSPFFGIMRAWQRVSGQPVVRSSSTIIDPRTGNRVQLPTALGAARFSQTWYAVLLIARGDMSWIGGTPISQSNWESLSAKQRARIPRVQPGFFNPTWLECGRTSVELTHQLIIDEWWHVTMQRNSWFQTIRHISNRIWVSQNVPQ